MSILNRYGVPTPSVNRLTQKQPKPKNKFRLQFFGFNNQEKGSGSKPLVKETDSVQLPKLEFKHHNMYRYDTETGYVGRHSWQDVNLVLKDSIDNDLMFALFGQKQKMLNYGRRIDQASINSRDYKFEMWIQAMVGSERVYDVISQAAGLLTDAISIGSSAIAGFQNGGLQGAAEGVLTADVTDYFQGTICTWVLEGCIVKEFDFGEMNYNESGFNTITLTIKPDNVYLRDNTGAPWYDPGFALSNIQGVINDPSVALGNLGGIF